MFLRCSTNNRSLTVYSLFIEAIQKYHLPSRVRTDQGRENILIAHHMIEHRGAERRSIITGSSVHNQRIERLWRDLHQGVTLLYYRLFYYLEECGILDPINERQVFALHYVFVPRINRSIDEFRQSWNHHRMRTAHHKSPYQLFNAWCSYTPTTISADSIRFFSMMLMIHMVLTLKDQSQMMKMVQL